MWCGGMDLIPEENEQRKGDCVCMEGCVCVWKDVCGQKMGKIELDIWVIMSGVWGKGVELKVELIDLRVLILLHGSIGLSFWLLI